MEGKSVIFLLGGPGSGKGTQAISITKEFGFGYAAAGDLLRAERANPDSAHGKEIAAIIDAGNIVPPELIVTLIREAIEGSESKYFLLDGFPRSLVQDDAFRASFKPCEAVFLLDCPDDVLIQRLTGRASTSGRADDTASVYPTRLLNHHNETMPVVRRYEEEGKVVRINGNQSIEKVREEMISELRKFWNF